jgi:hypothetical protein
LISCGSESDNQKLTIPNFDLNMLRDMGAACFNFEEYIPLPNLESGKNSYNLKLPSAGDIVDRKMDITVTANDGTTATEKGIIRRTEYNDISTIPNLTPSNKPSFFPDLEWPWSSDNFIAENINTTSYIYYYGDDGTKRLIEKQDNDLYAEYFNTEETWVLGETVLPALEIGKETQFEVIHYDAEETLFYWNQTNSFSVLGKKVIFTEMDCIEVIEIQKESILEVVFTNPLYEIVLQDEFEGRIEISGIYYVHPSLDIVLSEEHAKTYTEDPSIPYQTIQSKLYLANTNILDLPSKVRSY